MSSLAERLVKASKDPYASVISDGIIGDESRYYLDTGSYSLNALISGSIFKGMPSNRGLMYAGEQATGKSFFALEMAHQMQKAHKNAIVVYFDTEKALDMDNLPSDRFDRERFVILQPATIEDFRTQATRLLTELEGQEDRPEIIFVLDSLGMLSSLKEMGDVEDGKNVRDMTKTQLIKGTFRVLTLRMGVSNIPLVVVNHVYAKIGGMFPENEVSGGSGGKYAASTILTLTKSMHKKGAVQIGVIIKAKTYKSRLTKEKMIVETRLLFDRGLDRYWGLLPLALEAGIYKKIGNRYELPDGKMKLGTYIERDPETYFTQEILEKIDAWTQANFTLGKTSFDMTPEEEKAPADDAEETSE